VNLNGKLENMGLVSFLVFLLLFLSLPACSSEGTLWLELDIYFLKGNFFQEEGISAPEEWHVFKRLTGFLPILPGFPALIQPGGDPVKADFSPGIKMESVWGTHYCFDEDEGLMVEQIISPKISNTSELELFWDRNSGEIQLIINTPRFFFAEGSCSASDCNFVFPSIFPPENFGQQLVLVTAGEESWRDVINGQKTLTIQFADSLADMVLMISGKVEQYARQPYIGSPGQVEKRIIQLLRSPHVASNVAGQAHYLETYTVADMWLDNLGRTWLFLDFGDGRDGWYLP